MLRLVTRQPGRIRSWSDRNEVYCWTDTSTWSQDEPSADHLVRVPAREQFAYRVDYDRYNDKINSVRKMGNVVILSSLFQSVQTSCVLGFDEGNIPLILSNTRSPVIGTESRSPAKIVAASGRRNGCNLDTAAGGLLPSI